METLSRVNIFLNLTYLNFTINKLLTLPTFYKERKNTFQIWISSYIYIRMSKDKKRKRRMKVYCSILETIKGNWTLLPQQEETKLLKRKKQEINWIFAINSNVLIQSLKLKNAGNLNCTLSPDLTRKKLNYWRKKTRTKLNLCNKF